MNKRIPSIALLLTVALLFWTGCPNNDFESSASRTIFEQRTEEKTYWRGTVHDDFDGSSVLVVMDRYSGGMNREHNARSFGSFKKNT